MYWLSIFQKYCLTTARFCHCISLHESAGNAFLNIHCYWVLLILLLSMNFFVLAFLWCGAQVALVVKNSPANTGDIRDVGLILGLEDPLEEGMATHSSILTWESRRLAGYSPQGRRVGHDWSDLAQLLYSTSSRAFFWEIYLPTCRFPFISPSTTSHESSDNSFKLVSLVLCSSVHSLSSKGWMPCFSVWHFPPYRNMDPTVFYLISSYISFKNSFNLGIPYVSFFATHRTLSLFSGYPYCFPASDVL